MQLKFSNKKIFYARWFKNEIEWSTRLDTTKQLIDTRNELESKDSQPIDNLFSPNLTNLNMQISIIIQNSIMNLTNEQNTIYMCK